jgi:hypothetical protein
MLLATSLPGTIGAIGATLGVVGGVVTWWVNGVRAERIRLRKLYADAFSAVAAHQQFPYMIHRRRPPRNTRDDLESEERLRIANALHAVQEAFNNYRAQIAMESPLVSERYETLLTTARGVTGKYMGEAWRRPPISSDADFPIRLDFTELDAAKDAYLQAAQRDTRFVSVAFRRAKLGPQ